MSDDRQIRIVLADDHAVLRAGLRVLLNAEPDMVVVGEAGDGESCVAIAVKLQPDLVLLDINMPHTNGLEALAELRHKVPHSRVLILTMHDDAVYLRQVLAAGGAGYVLKEAADSELLTAIRTVYNGGVFLHPSHAHILLEQAINSAPAVATPDSQLSNLSDREQEVIRLIALGHTNKEIAEILHLSVKTVETYKARGMEKLNITTRSALVRFALKHGLVD
ncbi:MAG: response regulator transcription factor [Anaerolineaceae bacterium]|nr:response regulator transcription factor [Anaerolineaceae bacterium]MCB9098108.1 response regulator transcription factor [Anaerolineales bacterium]